MSRDSSVGIATGYGLDGPGSNPGWGRDISHTSRPALGTTDLLYNRYRVFLGGKAAGRGADHPPLLVPAQERVELYLYSPYGPSYLLRGTFTFY
jgi:hypothetical protein